MQTTGTVCTLRERSTNSRWIIGSPRCVSHSVHACTHAWQPMQRFGSMKKWRSSGFGMGLLLWLERRGVCRRSAGFADAAPADLVLRDLADGILRGDGEPVRALVAWPVVWNEDRVGTDRRHHHRPQCDRATARLRGRPVAVADAQLFCEPRVQFDSRLG